METDGDGVLRQDDREQHTRKDDLKGAPRQDVDD